MMCYRDRWWCNHWRDCALAKDCARPLTDEVLAAAERWWGKPGAPIDTPIEQPPCHIPKAGQV